MTSSRYPSYAELTEVFELKDGRLWRKEYVDTRNRNRGGFVENVHNTSNGYCNVGFKRRRIRYHVAVLILHERKDAPPGKVVNHIDNNRLNNRPDNLEWVSVRENSQKQRKHNEKAKLPGSYLDKRRGLYLAQARLESHHYFLGYHKTELEAFDSYIEFLKTREIQVDNLLELRAKYVEEFQVNSR